MEENHLMKKTDFDLTSKPDKQEALKQVLEKLLPFNVEKLEQIEAIKLLALKYNINLTGNVDSLSWNTKAMQEKYDITLEEIHLRNLLGRFSFPIKVENISKPYSVSAKSLADLDILLRNVIKNPSNITVSTTIKSIKSSVVLDSEIANDLLLFVDSLIEARTDGFYQYQFNWEFKEEIETGLVTKLTEPYSDEEISQIVEYETNKAISIKKQNKKRLSIKIKNLTEFLRKEGIFSLDYETISTSEACFIFDFLVLKGIIGKDETYNNQEKYQFIKSKLK